MIENAKEKIITSYAKAMLEASIRDCRLAMAGLEKLSSGPGLAVKEIHELQRNLYSATSAFQAYSNVVSGFQIPKKG